MSSNDDSTSGDRVTSDEERTASSDEEASESYDPTRRMDGGEILRNLAPREGDEEKEETVKVNQEAIGHFFSENPQAGKKRPTTRDGQSEGADEATANVDRKSMESALENQSTPKARDTGSGGAAKQVGEKTGAESEQQRSRAVNIDHEAVRQYVGAESMEGSASATEGDSWLKPSPAEETDPSRASRTKSSRSRAEPTVEVDTGSSGGLGQTVALVLFISLAGIASGALAGYVGYVYLSGGSEEGASSGSEPSGEEARPESGDQKGPGEEADDRQAQTGHDTPSEEENASGGDEEDEEHTMERNEEDERAATEEVERKVELNDMVDFERDKAEVPERSREKLAKIAETLRENPWIAKVRIEGHSDDLGSETYNERLSEQRAEAARDFLLERGVDPVRLEVVGVGSRRPVAPNDSEKNRERNRRVEFVIVELSGAPGPSKPSGE